MCTAAKMEARASQKDIVASEKRFLPLRELEGLLLIRIRHTEKNAFA